MLASLREYPNARSVLQRMAEDAERAQRIRDCYEARPDLTWVKIASEVHVAERTLLGWAKKGGPKYENCIRLAGVLGVDGDWLWSGKGLPERATPDLIGALGGETQLDRIERLLHDVASRLGAVEQPLAAMNWEMLLAIVEGHAQAPPAKDRRQPPTAGGS